MVRIKIVNRVKRLKGQINSIENAIEQPESSCIDILQQVAAIKGAINGLMSELMEQHLHHHVLKGAEVDQNELDEFLKVLKDTAEKVLDDIALYIIQFLLFSDTERTKDFA